MAMVETCPEKLGASTSLSMELDLVTLDVEGATPVSTDSTRTVRGFKVSSSPYEIAVRFQFSY